MNGELIDIIMKTLITFSKHFCPILTLFTSVGLLKRTLEVESNNSTYFSTWMELKEFNDLVLSFVDSDFPQRDIPLIFNYALKLQVNEIDNDKHYKMQFCEFLEAFCRAIDKASPSPPGSSAV